MKPSIAIVFVCVLGACGGDDAGQVDAGPDAADLGWTRVPVPTGVALRDVFAVAPDDVYLAGEDGVFHSDGGTFEGVANGFGSSVWAATPTDVFAVGDAGTLLYFDGATWVEQTPPNGAAAIAVWGLDEDNVLAGGNAGNLWRGGQIGGWAAEAGVTTGETFSAVWGDGAELFAATFEGSVFHHAGGAWASSDAAGSEAIHALHGTAPDDVWAVGGNFEAHTGAVFHFDGDAWSAVTTPATEELRGVWAESATSVYAVGSGGTILHFDGDTWDLAHLDDVDLTAIHGVAGAAWITAVDGKLWRRD